MCFRLVGGSETTATRADPGAKPSLWAFSSVCSLRDSGVGAIRSEAVLPSGGSLTQPQGPRVTFGWGTRRSKAQEQLGFAWADRRSDSVCSVRA